MPASATAARSIVSDCLAATLVVAASTVVCWFLLGRDHVPEDVMVYLLGIVIVSLRYGFAASLFATALSGFCVDLIFIPPYFSLAVSDFRHVVMFGVMFFVAVVISRLTQQAREQAEAREQLAREAQRSQLEVETERLRNALLSSVSHDLRTPLGVITGSASTLLSDDGVLTDAARRDLLATVYEEAERLNRLVANLLDMTRLASGALRVVKEWHPVDELVGVALARVESRLAGRQVDVQLPAELPPVAVDAVLVEQVLINLLENAAKYTPKNSALSITAHASTSPRGAEMIVEVADVGPGIPVEERTRIFEKFHRLGHEREGISAGLGLAICRGIVEAHGGRIWVDARSGGGSAFRLSLPLTAPPPELDAENTGERVDG
jgi:K+-sensing histidine kinase KdpD